MYKVVVNKSIYVDTEKNAICNVLLAFVAI